MQSVTRYHDISCGHRVVGHESKCRHLHGHNYRVHFTCTAEKLDSVGRVIDFSVIKEKLCMWIEDHWDHKFLAWVNDNPLQDFYHHTKIGSGTEVDPETYNVLDDSLVWTPFNPTAENMAEYLVKYVGPAQLKGTGVTLTKVVIEETAKCSATYELEGTVK